VLVESDETAANLSIVDSSLTMASDMTSACDIGVMSGPDLVVSATFTSA